ncbi:MAG: lipocalin family protein [Cyclobacteriaceae bacterium]|nr:lipocalin family protein [Cyclobacteriaceae bacterium]
MKMIKDLYLIAVMFSIILIIDGCKQDDPSPSEQLIGSWKYVSTVSSGCTDPTDNGTHTCSIDCTVLEFTSTTVKITDSSSITYTYTISGSTLKVTVQGQIETYTLSISGKTLTLTEQATMDDGNCKDVSTYTKL